MDVQPEWEWLLQVTLLDASNLAIVHFRSSFGNWIPVNPACSLVFNGRSVASSEPCKGGGTNPSWREVLEMRVHDGVVSLPDGAIFAVIYHFDYKNYKHRHIGTATIPLTDFLEGAWSTMTYQVIAAEMTYQAIAAENAVAGETQATVKVRLQKRKVPKLIAPANSTTEVPPSPSSSMTNDLLQTFIASLQLGMDIGSKFFGDR